MSETTRWLPLVPETNYSRKPIIELQAIINFFTVYHRKKCLLFIERQKFSKYSFLGNFQQRPMFYANFNVITETEMF